MSLFFYRRTIKYSIVNFFLIGIVLNCVPVKAIETQKSIQISFGKSKVVVMPADVLRLSVGNPEVADVLLINSREVYLLGKKVGTTNVMVWTKTGITSVIDLSVGLDVESIRKYINQLLPNEKNVRIDALGDALVLSGSVSNSIKMQRIYNVLETFTDTKKIINLLYLEGSQQVMLEVKVAEVSKSLMDQLGFGVNGSRTTGAASFGIISSFLGTGAGTLSAGSGSVSIQLDAEIKKGLVKILAEPAITAISGQEGSFLAGGKIFIPVPQASGTGASTIVLEEREFGVGLKFTPTVLEDGLINLRVTPEVSELSQVGTVVTAGGGQVGSPGSGQTSILPSITTRRASTTVQLRDGESFAIGGLIKNNVTSVMKVFPVLGELPILGVLFRSTSFQADRTELVFVVTPHLVKPTAKRPILPTDNFIEPTRREFHWEGREEGIKSKPDPLINDPLTMQ
jgi:pilus assembly protein CpaC